MRQRGFSLIELLIVVAIILVIAAMAIPNLLRARISANEASAVLSLRAVNTAQTTHASTYPDHGFADNLAKLGASSDGTVSWQHSGLLDWVLGCASQPCPKSGYLFSIINPVGSPVSSFGVTGVPSMPGSSGVRGFCSDDQNPVRVDPAGGVACTVPLQ